METNPTDEITLFRYLSSRQFQHKLKNSIFNMFLKVTFGGFQYNINKQDRLYVISSTYCYRIPKKTKLIIKCNVSKASMNKLFS